MRSVKQKYDKSGLWTLEIDVFNAFDQYFKPQTTCTVKVDINLLFILHFAIFTYLLKQESLYGFSLKILVSGGFKFNFTEIPRANKTKQPQTMFQFQSQKSNFCILPP